MIEVELRCDRDPRRMFGKLLRDESVRIDSTSNLMEFACDRCRKATGAVQVYHRFDILGVLVETEILR
jgi:hypothetical protein